ncbi:hypothetical protein Dda_4804 [Drechslerella dactyloides]|uniref:Serine protease n=1 Tax=Drechslerella dactyloides TaxID=74499 RepID=A0AAD6IXM8_DREDA|nr:hypothetical protein Dda_4804 [Drechslerella dactyloides]
MPPKKALNPLMGDENSEGLEEPISGKPAPHRPHTRAYAALERAAPTAPTTTTAAPEMQPISRTLPEGEIPDWEARCYYYGIPSQPRLVYRTDTIPLTRPGGVDVVQRESFPVYNHNINKVWDEVGPKIIQILDSHEVRWTSIDVAKFKITRLGSKRISPVILWIGVVPATLSADKAREASTTCLHLLETFGITDIELEYRESLYVRAAGLRLKAPDQRRSWFSRPLDVALSLPIAARATSDAEGSGGLYIAEGGAGKNIYLLTARHVVLHPLRMPNDAVVAHRSAPRREVMLLGPEGFDKMVSRVSGYIDYLEYVIPKQQGDAKRERLERDAGQNAGMGPIEQQHQERREDLRWCREFREEIRADWQESNRRERTIGYIDYSPPFTYGDRPGTWSTDYALILLDKKKLRQNFKGNVLDLSGKPERELVELMHAGTELLGVFYYPDDGLFPLRGVMSESEIKNPSTEIRGSEGILVMLNGKESGVTVGRAGGCESYCRDYFRNGKTQTSIEWPVHAYRGKAFSQQGDSGSIIVDGRGRIGGFLTAGASKAESTDISYATPFFWILDHIKKNRLPNAHIHPTMD